MVSLNLMPSLGLSSLTSPVTGAVAGAAGAQGAAGNFAQLVQGMVNQTVQAQGKAEALSMAAAQGQQVPLHEVVQALSQAQVTLQTLVTVRDRAVEAYQEVARMPI